MMFAPNLFNQLFWRHIVLFGAQHDRGAVGIISAHVVAFVAAQFLEADPDIGLDIFYEVANVDGAVGIGQGAGDEDSTVLVAHGTESRIG